MPTAVAKPSIIEKPTVPSVVSFADVDEDERTRIADAGALAGAFSLAVGGQNDSAGPDSLSMPADEWFVGINGVPVGPIRLSELRSKAASGSVNRESLVWRDGFEDWRPLGTFPELSAIVDESVSSARASLTPFTPPAAPVSAPTPSPGNAVPVLVPVASSPDIEAYAGSGNGVTGAAVVTDELEAAGVPKRSGTSPAAWIAVGIALMFGLTIGFVLFNKNSKPVEVIKYVDRPVPGASSVAAAEPQASAASVDGPSTPTDPKNPTKRVASTAKSAAPGASAETDKGIAGLKGLSGLGALGPKGPDSTGPSGTVGGGTGQLDGAQIQSTVSRYTGSVKRACWQPALDTRDKDAPTTARVNVQITVQPSGSVSGATVNGGDPKGYRGLSQCISSRVRGWQFPPSGETTTVNVPFVFAAQ
ncbi:MAG TPA: GYF domain-containing protein [Polyangiaceae bacterium]|nr:GYF domain-containing protein [Polyangiaceae bacterium]